jgi:hypothetical protein
VDIGPGDITVIEVGNSEQFKKGPQTEGQGKEVVRCKISDRPASADEKGCTEANIFLFLQIS